MIEEAAPELASRFDAAALDELRASEYGRLDAGEHVYLDYTGGSLHAESQLREHQRLLSSSVLGNPHSSNPTSSAMTELVEHARGRVLQYFNASPDEYAVIFTMNATAALRMIGEAYPFGPGDRFLLTFDNHNSVNGIREFARAKRATTTYVPSTPPDLRVDTAVLEAALDRSGPGHGLFAFPAQSNFSGVQHPLEWIGMAKERGWDVVVDCAAFVPTNRLDLSAFKPDFVPISFYKLFGYPTGVGCLIARHEALVRLRRPWFAGGTVVAAVVQEEWHRLLAGPAGFEDGTLNYLAIPGVEIGLRHVEQIGIATIHARVTYLGSRLMDQLERMTHSNGAPLVEIYGPRLWHARGATIAFNFLHPDGRRVDERLVDRVACCHNVSLRTGCFCNPGSGEIAFTVQKDLLAADEFRSATTVDRFLQAAGLPTGGAVRVSLGIASNLADVQRFVDVASDFRDLDKVPTDLPPRLAC